ncbi:MAG: T9SS type A sorting domain-containing protein [Bacteroidales bacterium]|nr:T9SS type A sorting domain-containing protein [Bacteroidales bacterium]
MKRLLLSMLAFAATSMLHAQIVYTNLESNPVVMDSAYVSVHDMGYEINFLGGGAEYAIQNYAAIYDGSESSYFACFESGAKVMGNYNDVLIGTAVTPLEANAEIGATGTYVGSEGGVPHFATLYQRELYSAWMGKTAYVGLQFVAGGNTYYGWAKLSMSANRILTLYGYAFQSTPGVSILAGATTGGVGIGEASHDAIAVYPNPATNFVNVKGVESRERVSIADLSGRTLWRGVAGCGIDVSALPKGVYVLKAKEHTAKIVKK